VTTPIVYVETNWLIALLFPHDGHHEWAMDLFGRMSMAEGELRIVFGACARHPGRRGRGCGCRGVC
jgi:hypothetical protein